MLRAIRLEYMRAIVGIRNQALADRIIMHDFANLVVQSGEFLPQFAPCSQQWLNDHRQIGQALDQLANTLFILNGSNHANLQTEIAQKPTNVVLNGNGLFL